MSSSVDNKIVKMQFDNAQFEAGVMKSMNTIDKLNEKLQFKESKKGVSALQVALDGIDFNAMLRGVQNVEHAFTSFTGMIGQKIKTEIVDSLINGAKQIEQATIGQIKSGGWARATNIANAKFTIEGLKYSWDEVRAAADYAVTDTAYGLDAAAKAASQLAASGVDFHKIIGKDGAGNDVTQMHKALRGVSGVAAMTNSDFSEIANIFTRIAGQGRVMATDLNSIAARGINAAAEMAKQFGITEAELRDLVSRGQISFNDFAMAMDDAFGDHAKEANKTFSGSLSNMKAALSRIGAIFAQPVMDKTNTFFIAITSRIKEFQKALSDTKGYTLSEKGLKNIRKKAEDTLKSVKGLSEMEYANRLSAEINRLKDLSLGDQLAESLKVGDVESYPIMRFAGHFEEAWEAGVNAASKIVENLDLSWFQNIGTFLDNVAIKMKTVFDGIVNYYEGIQTKFESVRDKMRATIGISLEDWKYINEVAIKGSYGTMQERWDKLDKDIKETLDEEGGGKRIQGYVNQFAAVGYVWEKLGWDYETVEKKQNELNKAFETGVQELSGEELVYASVASAMDTAITSAGLLKEAFFALFDGAKNIGKAIGQTLVTAFHYFSEGFDTVTISASLKELASAFSYFTEALLPTEGFLTGVGAAAQTAGTFLSGLLTKVIQVTTAVVTFAGDLIRGTKSLDELKSAADVSPIEKFAAGIVVAFTNIKTVLSNAFTTIKKILGSIKSAFTKTFKSSGVSEQVGGLTDKLSSLSEKFVLSDDSVEKLTAAFETVFGIVKKVGTGFKSLLSTVTGLFSKKGLGALGKSTSDAASEIADMADEVVNVSVNTEKAEGIFYRLKIILHNIIEAVKEAPGKFKAFIDELKESEAVIRLKESFEKLKTSIKETFDKVLPPAEKMLGVLGATEESTATEASDRAIWLAENIIDAITWVVDKITWLVEQIPSWKDAIVGFLTDVQTAAILVYDTVTGKVDDIGKKYGVEDAFNNLSDSWKKAAENASSIKESITNFGSDIFTTISEAVKTVDWNSIGKVSFLTLIGANLYKFFGVLSAGEGLLTNIASVPKMISGFFKNLGGTFAEITKSVKKLTNIYILISLIGALAALAGAVVLLKDIDFETGKNIVALLTSLSLVFLILGATVYLITKNQKMPQSIQRSENTLMQIQATLPGLISVAAVILSLGGAIYLLIKAFVEAAKAIDGVKDESFEKALKAFESVGTLLLTFTLVLSILLALTGGLGKKISKSTSMPELDEKNTANGLKAIAVFMIGLGAGIYLIVKSITLLAEAMDKVSDTKMVTTSLLFVFGFVAALGVIAYALTTAAQNINYKSVLAIAAVILALVGAVYVILTQVTALALELAGASMVGQTESVVLAISSVIGGIIAIGFGIYLLTKNLAGMGNETVKTLGKTLIGMGVVILILAGAIKLIASSFTGISEDEFTYIMFGMFGALGMVGLMIQYLNWLANGYGSDFDANRFIKIMASLSGAVLVLALSTFIMANAFTLGEPAAAIGGFAIATILMGVLAGVLALIVERLKGIDSNQIITVMASISGAILIIAIGVLAIGAAAHLMSGMTEESLNTFCIALLGVLAIFAILSVLTYVLSNNKDMDSKAITDVLLALGASILLISAAVLVLAIGAKKLENVNPDTLWGIIKVVGVLALIFALMTALSAIFPGAKDAFKVAGDAFLKFAVALVLVGAAVLLMGAGLGLLGGGMGKLAEGLGILGKAIKENKAAMIVVITLVLVFVVVLVLVAKEAETVLSVAAIAAEGVSKFFKKIISGFKTIKDKAKESITGDKGIGAKLKKWWTDLVPKAKVAIATGIVTILGGLAAATPEALEHIGDIIFKVLKWIISLLPELIGWVLDFIIALLNGLAEKIRENSAKLAAAILNIVESLVEVLAHVVGELLSALFGFFGLEGIGEEIRNTIDVFITWMRNGQQEVDSYAGSLKKLTDSTEEYAEANKKAVKAETKGISALVAQNKNLLKHRDQVNAAKTGLLDLNSINAEDIAGNLKKMSDSVPGFDLSTPFQNVKSSPNPLGLDFTEMLSMQDVLNNPNTNGYMGGALDGTIAADQYGSGFEDAVNNAELGPFGGLDAASMVADAKGDAYGEGYDFGTDFALGEVDGEGVTYSNNIASSIDNTDSRSQVQDATNNLMDASHDTMQSPENQKKAADAVYNGIQDPMRKRLLAGRAELVEWAKGYGSAIPDGIMAACKDREALAKLEDGMVQCAQAQLDAYTSKDGIDSHSPSKKFYQAGLFCVLGVRDAIAENTGLASDAMFNLSDQMINSFGDPLDYVSKMASGEIQYDPSIRPILDPSMLGTGVNTIDSMFANQNVSLSGMSGQIAYDMSTLNGSNAAVVAEIQALREDMDYMTEQMTNMQIVMDTGALVGATSGAMDKNLGIKRLYSERGDL